MSDLCGCYDDTGGRHLCMTHLNALNPPPMPDLPERDYNLEEAAMVVRSRMEGDAGEAADLVNRLIRAVRKGAESRLREVEAEMVAMKLQVQFAHELAEDKVEAMREQLADLRADLKALVKVDGEVPLCVHCGEHRTRCPGGC